MAPGKQCIAIVCQRDCGEKSGHRTKRHAAQLFFFLGGGGGHRYFGDPISSLNKILNLTGYEPMSSKFDLRESAEAIEPSSFE